ncbi:NADPH-dependent ferric siderophore reductase, contains FAD-binding and SIP domains [Streptomyces indicus]|uniref:NADPH-dependent ferric siderophore reductase, contains FAD-binding and SIP domains n=2 Tax=Streptomyces indicus TaxID=417292 RepID=A0A1G9G107_9ACTN|nr:NADPH-dependent ferric siderophore reductase, contains FAD-binding and SIP domains [Streptomyces indicus]
MAKGGKYLKPQEREFLVVRGVARKRISPSFVRVTLGGEALKRFTPMGYDQWFRLFLPVERGLRLPKRTGGLWVAEYMLMSKDTRPVGRNYTVRAHRTEGLHGEGPEIDVDFALHADAEGGLGPASAWARDGEESDEVGILDEGITFLPPSTARWHLLVGDETALPAIAGIIASADDGRPVRAYIEVPHEEDVQELGVPAHATVEWVIRKDGAPSGEGALAAVQSAALPDGPGYAWVAGGRRLATQTRRHLVGERGFTKDAVTFTGYWR